MVCSTSSRSIEGRSTVCQCGCTVETAEPPARLIPGGRYSTEFAVHVAADKYDGHLPLERQARRMRRSGLTVTSQTLWDQTWALAGCFRDAIDRLRQYLLSKELLLADESRWPLLGAKGRKTKNWFAWTLASEDAILHRIEDTRSNEACRSLLTGFRGVLVTDGYVVYKSLATEIGYVQAHRWSHARRKFIEAEPSASDLSANFLDDIGELFGIERTLAERTLDLPPVEAVRLREQVRDEAESRGREPHRPPSDGGEGAPAKSYRPGD
ncbi:MAG: transposase [Deltaproteobacteria bacterium]